MITVIGAGLGGLTLAAVLHRRGIEVAVYDLDASPAARHQGGMLDIHEDSGQVALHAAGLYDGFRAAYLAGADATRILDKTGASLFESSHDSTSPVVMARCFGSSAASTDALISSVVTPASSARMRPGYSMKSARVDSVTSGRPAARMVSAPPS